LAVARYQLVDPNYVVSDSDYDAIESAIMESSRGRWFLSEYARRNRRADTNLLLSAIDEIRQTINSYKRTSDQYLVKISFSSFLDNVMGNFPLRLSQVGDRACEEKTLPPAANDATATDIHSNSDDATLQTSQPSYDDDLNVFLFK